MIKRIFYAVFIFSISFIIIFRLPVLRGEIMSKQGPEDIIKLKQPVYDSGVSVEETLLKRRSVRDFRKRTLTLGEVSQLLWAAQGVTDKRGFRTAPSAGALYPLETYIIVGDVEGISPGVYKYIPSNNVLVLVISGDRRSELSRACYKQKSVRENSVVIALCAVYERITGRYGDRGLRYVHMEAGHAGQNVALQAVSLGLGTVMIGAFDAAAG